MRIGLLQRPSIALFPDVFDQRGVNGRLDWAALIIAGLDSESGGLAWLIHILIWLNIDEKTAMRGNDGRGARDFPIGRIGDASFNSIAHVPVPLIDLGGNSDSQFAIGVELS